MIKVSGHRAHPAQSAVRDGLPIINNRLQILAKPNARKTAVSKIESATACIDIAASPERDKANIELLHFLRKLTKRSCRIVSGARSKSKIVAFD